MSVIVSIPKQLCHSIANNREIRQKYNTNRMFKVVETWAYLKNVTTSGKIHRKPQESHSSFMKRLAAACYVHPNCINYRLKWAQEAGFIRTDEYGNIILTSYRKINSQYNIENHYYTLEINPENEKLEHLLKTLVFNENKERQRRKFKEFIDKNPYVAEKIEVMFPDATKYNQLRDAIIRKQIESFQKGSENYDFLMSLNPDDNLSLSGISKIFGYSRNTGGLYQKAALIRLNLIEATKRVYSSKKCTRLPDNMFSGGKVKRAITWNPKTKCRILQYPDKILTAL